MHLVSTLALFQALIIILFTKIFINEKFGEMDRFEFAVNAYSLDVKDFMPTDMFLDDKPSIEFSIIKT